MKEGHDDGLRWMNAAMMRDAVRSDPLVYFTTAANTANREYGFGEDGLITCRLGEHRHTTFSTSRRISATSSTRRMLAL